MPPSYFVFPRVTLCATELLCVPRVTLCAPSYFVFPQVTLCAPSYFLYHRVTLCAPKLLCVPPSYFSGIVISEFLKRHQKAMSRTPAHSRAAFSIYYMYLRC